MRSIATNAVAVIALSCTFTGAGFAMQFQDEPAQEGGQAYGWTVQQGNVDENQLDRELTELERLSKSASGMRLGSQFYDSKSDNPLKPVSVTLRGLDKITAQYTDLIIKIGETSEFGTLSITARTCDKRPPEEFPETTAFLEITSVAAEIEVDILEAPLAEADSAEGIVPIAEEVTEPEQEPDAQEQMAILKENGLVFSGWMFASSPALNALEHSVYDVWIIDCKMVDPSAG